MSSAMILPAYPSAYKQARPRCQACGPSASASGRAPAPECGAHTKKRYARRREPSAHTATPIRGAARLLGLLLGAAVFLQRGGLLGPAPPLPQRRPLLVIVLDGLSRWPCRARAMPSRRFLTVLPMRAAELRKVLPGPKMSRMTARMMSSSGMPIPRIFIQPSKLARAEPASAARPAHSSLARVALLCKKGMFFMSKAHPFQLHGRDDRI